MSIKANLTRLLNESGIDYEEDINIDREKIDILIPPSIAVIIVSLNSRNHRKDFINTINRINKLVSNGYTVLSYIPWQLEKNPRRILVEINNLRKNNGIVSNTLFIS